TYDALGRVVEEVDGNGDDQDYTYNVYGFVNSVTNGNGKIRNYTRTKRGEVTSLTHADNSVEQWSFDGEGNMTLKTDPLNRDGIGGNDQTILTYDDAGQPTLVNRPIGTDFSLSYDDAGRRTSMTDGTGTTYWDYDNSNRLVELVQPNGKQVYGYNNANQSTSMTEYSGSSNLGSTTYSYGSTSGRLDSLTNRHSQTTGFAYDALGRLSVKTHHNGVYETTTYDNRSRIDTITIQKPDSTVIRTHDYGYDDASQITSHQIDLTTTSYGYDGVGQLTSESRTGYSASYAYDGNRNRTSRSVNGTTHTYVYDTAGADKLMAIKIGSTTIRSYTYDNLGQPTEVSEGGLDTDLVWDDDARLTSLTPPGASAQIHGYNGFGAQIASQGLSLVRNGVGVTAPVLRDGIAEYTPRIAEKRSGSSKYLSGDLESFDVQTSSTAGVTSKRTYDAFGNLDTTIGGSWLGPFGYGGRFGYQTEGSRLQLLGHRWYDAEVGRFLTRDPIMDGRNWYAYCDNDPVGSTDPNGLDAINFLNPMDEFIKGWDDWWDNLTGARDLPTQDLPGIDSRGEGPPVFIYPDSSPFPPNAVTPNTDTIWLPPHITPDEFMYSPRHTWLYNHEMGHIEQARVTGPTYLAMIGVALFAGMSNGGK
ncbi:MAG: hypothetical protein EON58_13985, partial [Alphaproteobacteria bacterium]